MILVAYRGLWDKFAAPDSMAAVARAYGRGVPSLVRVKPGSRESVEALEIAFEAGTNPLRQPLYLFGAPHEWIARTRGQTGAPPLYVIEPQSAAHLWPIYGLTGGAFVPAGWYVPFAAAMRGLETPAASEARLERPLVLFESADIGTPPHHGEAGLTDAETICLLRLFGPNAVIACVTDLVEARQLADRVREAS